MLRSLEPSRLTRGVLAAGLGVALSTLAIVILEDVLGVPNASSVYVVAVAVVAILSGITAAVLTSVLGILVYDFLFTEPIHTLTVSDPGEWLSLVLLLFVAVTVGQLAALQRRRAESALARERESRALFQVTGALATTGSLAAALPAMLETLAEATGMASVWLGVGADDASERVLAHAGDQPARRAGRAWYVLHPAESGARWTLVRPPPGSGSRADAGSARLFRVRIVDGSRPAGSLWAEGGRGGDLPDPQASALLLVTADLLGQALARERLAEQSQRAEIARQSDAVKTALLESVSHNLRTPLASIRASAGTLMDPEVTLTEEEARASAESIDREAQRLNRLVGNLLDLSRIEGGALRAAREIVDLDEVVEHAATRVRGRLGTRTLTIDVAPGLSVVGDPVLLEEAVVNLLDNGVAHTPADARIHVRAGATDEGLVRLTVEDSGEGVPDALLNRIFDKFFRGPGGTGRRSPGAGIGLAVVRGFVEANGGRVEARPSGLGGLAIDVHLPAAREPEGDVDDGHDAPATASEAGGSREAVISPAARSR